MQFNNTYVSLLTINPLKYLHSDVSAFKSWMRTYKSIDKVFITVSVFCSITGTGLPRFTSSKIDNELRRFDEMVGFSSIKLSKIALIACLVEKKNISN